MVFCPLTPEINIQQCLSGTGRKCQIFSFAFDVNKTRAIVDSLCSPNWSLLRKVKAVRKWLVTLGWFVVLGFNATLTAKVISWRSVTHMCFLAFSHQY